MHIFLCCRFNNDFLYVFFAIYLLLLPLFLVMKIILMKHFHSSLHNRSLSSLARRWTYTTDHTYSCVEEFFFHLRFWMSQSYSKRFWKESEFVQVYVCTCSRLCTLCYVKLGIKMFVYWQKSNIPIPLDSVLFHFVCLAYEAFKKLKILPHTLNKAEKVQMNWYTGMNKLFQHFNTFIASLTYRCCGCLVMRTKQNCTRKVKYFIHSPPIIITWFCVPFRSYSQSLAQRAVADQFNDRNRYTI